MRTRTSTRSASSARRLRRSDLLAFTCECEVRGEMPAGQVDVRAGLEQLLRDDAAAPARRRSERRPRCQIAPAGPLPPNRPTGARARSPSRCAAAGDDDERRSADRAGCRTSTPPRVVLPSPWPLRAHRSAKAGAAARCLRSNSPIAGVAQRIERECDQAHGDDPEEQRPVGVVEELRKRTVEPDCLASGCSRSRP